MFEKFVDIYEEYDVLLSLINKHKWLMDILEEATVDGIFEPDKYIVRIGNKVKEDGLTELILSFLYSMPMELGSNNVLSFVNEITGMFESRVKIPKRKYTEQDYNLFFTMLGVYCKESYPFTTLDRILSKPTFRDLIKIVREPDAILEELEEEGMDLLAMYILTRDEEMDTEDMDRIISIVNTVGKLSMLNNEQEKVSRIAPISRYVIWCLTNE